MREDSLYMFSQHSHLLHKKEKIVCTHVWTSRLSEGEMQRKVGPHFEMQPASALAHIHVILSALPTQLSI